MLFGKLDINPAKNPAVLDTATWEPVKAWKIVQALDDAYWRSLEDAAAKGAPLPAGGGLAPYTASCARHHGALYCLAGLADGQQVFLEMGDVQAESVLGAVVGVKSFPEMDSQIALYPTDAEVVDRFFRFIKPEKGPQALRAVPRLGIGTRMTTAVWPGVWRAMAQGHFAANAIQNSVRELNLLENLTAARPAEKNIAFNFGTIESGYTGSTFEGLWVAGTLDALKSETLPRYGADADHIQVKRGSDGLARAKRLVEAARYYSFFTLDVSDVLNYGALNETAQATAEVYLDELLTPDQRKAVRACHQRPLYVGGQAYQPDNATLGRLVGKYWNALNAVQELYSHIRGLKNGMPFDLELSIDEHPPEVATFDCLTTEFELLFLLLEMQRRDIPLTHVAPNLGIEKGTDYRCPDGLDGLEVRTRLLSNITQEMGVMLDVHSGDDLSSATRRAIRRATGGRNHFKVSPMLQLLFAEVLADYHPELFRRWWYDALAYAQCEASAGSAFAAECVQQCLETSLAPSPHDSVFHHFSFAFVGRRDAQGQFLYRDEFYDLSPAFYRAFQDYLVHYLCGLAAELF